MTLEQQNDGGFAASAQNSNDGDAAAFDAFVDSLGEPSTEEVMGAVDGPAANETPPDVGGGDALPPQSGDGKVVTPPQQPVSGAQESPPAQPQAQQPPVQQQQPPAQQPVDFETFVTQNQDQVVKHLAATQFALTDAEREAMGDAAPVVAAYTARAQLNSMRTMVSALQKSLPVMVGQLVQTMVQAKVAEDQFFSEYPAIKDVDRNTLLQIGQHLKATQPNLKGADFRRTLAATVAAARGIQLQPQQQQQQQAPANGLPKAPFQSAGANAGGASVERIPAQGGQQKAPDPLQGLFDALGADDDM